MLQWSNFVPSTDVLLKKMIEDDFMKNTGAVVNIEFIDQNTIAPKIAAAIQSGSGPDIIQFAHNWPHQYQESLVDVSDVAQEVQGWTGPFYPGFDVYSKVGGKYLAVPTEFIGTVVHWRKSWFKEVGVEKFPTTWEEYFEVGKKLKAKGHPLGESLGHSIGDPVFFTNPLMWSYGGSEIDASGKVAINSPATIEAVKLVKTYWNDAFDETGLAWDDSANNRAFLAETIAATQNGASIWWSARKDQVPFFDDIGLDFLPSGPKGRFWMGQLWTMGIMKYSKNVDAAKAFMQVADVRRRLDADVRGVQQLHLRHRPEAERQPDLGEVPAGDPGLQGRSGWVPHPRIAWAAGPEGRAVGLEVHHRRHVREGRPGRDAGGGGRLGRDRAEADLRRVARGRPSPSPSPAGEGDGEGPRVSS